MSHEPKPWRTSPPPQVAGEMIVGKYGDDRCLIRWANCRQCMLAGVGGGNGYLGAGWEDDYNRLIVDAPDAWMTEEEAFQTFGELTK